MNTLSPSEIEKEVLLLACEDYTGLYEIVWALNTSHPKISENEKIAAASNVVQSLLNQGLIELFISEWASHSYESVPFTEFSRVVRDPTTWQPGERNFSFAATDAGERFFLRGEKPL